MKIARTYMYSSKSMYFLICAKTSNSKIVSLWLQRYLLICQVLICFKWVFYNLMFSWIFFILKIRAFFCILRQKQVSIDEIYIVQTDRHNTFLTFLIIVKHILWHTKSNCMKSIQFYRFVSRWIAIQTFNDFEVLRWSFLSITIKNLWGNIQLNGNVIFILIQKKFISSFHFIQTFIKQFFLL